VVITGAMGPGEEGSKGLRPPGDLASLSDLPSGLAVHRLPAAVDNWPRHAVGFAAPRLARVTRVVGLDERWWRGGLGWRFQRFYDRLAFPDRGVWRLPAAVKLAVSLHRRYRFDAIVSSGMPFSDHLIGLALQSILRRPWLADFRDPWVEYIHWRQWQTEWGGRLTRAAEAAVVRRASYVISVNDHMTRRFAARYGGVSSAKFVTVQNGFDAADFPREVEGKPRARFRLLYAGSLYGARNPTAVLEAYRHFLCEVPGSRRHARFDFAGRPGPHVEELTRAGEDGRVQYLGLLSYGESLRSMASADVNVIILPKVPGSENDTTTKTYECLGSGRAILAAVPLDGAAAEVLRRFDGVWLCDPEDVAGIARAMTALYQRWLAGTLRVDRPEEGLRAFTREHQTRRLAGFLDSAASSSSRRVAVGAGTGDPG
jgi:glycosyltransferase involved in cell wall biosynthesis